MPPAITAKLRFDKSGYYFIALMVLAFAGFWNSYFSKFFNGTNNYSFYFHFHAAMMVLWVGLLIIQPLLIRRKKLQLHRLLGRTTYVLMPVRLVSVLLVLNNGLKAAPAGEQTFLSILFPVRDFILLAVAFTIGVRYRHKVQIHARAMVITGIVFIEPALFRLLGNTVPRSYGILAAVLGMAIILGLVITVIVKERKQKSGRWLFPTFLIVDVVVYSLVMLKVPLTFLDPFVRWFARLPLT